MTTAKREVEIRIVRSKTISVLSLHVRVYQTILDLSHLFPVSQPDHGAFAPLSCQQQQMYDRSHLFRIKGDEGLAFAPFSRQKDLATVGILKDLGSFARAAMSVPSLPYGIILCINLPPSARMLMQPMR